MGSSKPATLPIAYELREYRIKAILGRGGFAVTYVAETSEIGTRVAVKEYLPAEFALRIGETAVEPCPGAEETFQWGLDRFLQEAQTLDRFRHRNIVRVRHFFRANGTGYLVMDYEDGEDLETLLKREGPPEEERLRSWIDGILAGLEKLHGGKVLHRDIKPSNVYIRRSGEPVLLDFGSARNAFSERTHALTNVLTPGYAPLEQYSSGRQGAFTDIYAVGATAYRAIVGKRPPDATERVYDDPLVPAVEIGRGGYSETFLRALDASLKVNPADRPQSIAEWRRLFAAEVVAPIVAPPTPLTATEIQPAGPPRVQPQPPPPVPRPRRRWMAMGWIAVVLLASAAVITYLHLQGDGNDTASHADPATRARIKELVAKAEAQVRTGKLLEPANDNAVTSYQQIAPLDASVAVGGLAGISRILRERAGSELRRGDEFGAMESLMLAREAAVALGGLASIWAKPLRAEIEATDSEVATLAQTPPSNKVAQVDGQVADVQLFEKGPGDYPKAGTAAYKTELSATSARYVCYELTYSHPPLDTDRTVEFAAVVYRDGRPYSTSDRLRTVARAGALRSAFQSCMGKDTPGAWAVGSYRYDVYADGKKVASRDFPIVR